SVSELHQLVIASQYVGQTEVRQGLLKNQLKKLFSQSPSPQTGYLYARVLQREHQFDEALRITESVLNMDDSHINTRLLRANILMVKGEFNKAKKQCLTLLGIAATEIVTICTTDVLSQNGQLAQSYQSLKNSIPISKQTLNSQHLLAEMAFRLNKPSQALSHINNVELNQAPVSLVVLWADIQLALGAEQLILSTLPKLTNDPLNLEDALLLRLAIAEKNITDKNEWQQRMSKRVELRELRQDTFHASDLALYYLSIDKQTEKALYWANINWQQAKLDADKQLLSQAKEASL
ncbi:MAG: tetratricopeptide repeat protein, partial [Pseudoalteromonas sp.]